MENCESLGIELILHEQDRPAPSCPHGPTLLFEKACVGGAKGRRFYACSACRDRKDCNFFQWEDEKVSEARLLAREQENKSKMPTFTHKEYCARLKKFTSLMLHEKMFCVECELLLLPEERLAHSSHRLSEVTSVQLRRPSALLPPLENKKSNAQYLFTDRSAHFLLETLLRLGFTKVLCVGTPRLHELIMLRNFETKEKPMKSLLLDIDIRYAQFYGQREFCHYNMFNHHLFGAKASRDVLQGFLCESEGERLVMVADPPFGGLVKPLANSFSLLSQAWEAQHSNGGSVSEMPMIWIFPYFFEPRIVECLPSLKMLDYQVDYENHPLYKHGKSGRKQSPVRLFTNICPKDLVLPKEEGYRFCSLCQRYVWSLNKHCSKCNVCPSKDGREWKHCSICEKCVKPSWKHCGSCSRCTLPDHPCGSKTDQGCFNCGSLAHKRNSCPQRERTKFGKKGKTGKKMGAVVKANAIRKSGAERKAKKAVPS
ncbi:unnamed protein product [Knipowitschia caucasica]